MTHLRDVLGLRVSRHALRTIIIKQVSVPVRICEAAVLREGGRFRAVLGLYVDSRALCSIIIEQVGVSIGIRVSDGLRDSD